MTPLFIISTTILGILIFIEARFSPRFDITEEGDLLIWYYLRWGRNGCDQYRHFKRLFKIKK